MAQSGPRSGYLIRKNGGRSTMSFRALFKGGRYAARTAPTPLPIDRSPLRGVSTQCPRWDSHRTLLYSPRH
jgi:hypothetical protein